MICDNCKKEIDGKPMVMSCLFYSIHVCKTCGEYNKEHGRFPGEKCSKCGEARPLNIVGHCAECAK